MAATKEPTANGNGHSSALPGARVNTYTKTDLDRLEDLVGNVFTSRNEILASFLGRDGRNIDEECDYPDVLNAQLYRSLFDRSPIAERTAQLMPTECFQVTPDVFEDESSKKPTEFEDGWDELGSRVTNTGTKSWHKDEKGSSLWSLILRADELSGIGSFGLILLGIDDGKLLQDPADGVPADGYAADVTGVTSSSLPGVTSKHGDIDVSSKQFAGNMPVQGLSKDIYGGVLPQSPLSSTMGTDAQYFQTTFSPMGPGKAKKKGDKANLLFVRVYDESLIQVVQYEANMYSPRFGQPLMYQITLNDPRTQHTGIGLPLATVRCHWSRVIHLADNLVSSEIFGKPRMMSVVNNLLDLRKMYGGSAEGYWQSSVPGLSIETNPQLGGEVLIDKDGLRDMMGHYRNKLQRYIALMGMTAKSLSPSTLDPTPYINAHIQAICIKLRCPVRVFMGSERGELASSQDDAAWNDRLAHRQNTYVTPKVIAPFIDRLILLGVLPEPEEYHVEWPDLDSNTKSGKAAIFLQRVQAYAAAVAGNLETIFTPHDIMTQLDGSITDEEAQAILDRAKDAHEDEATMTMPPAGEEGHPATVPPPPPKPVPPPEQPIALNPGQKLVMPSTGKPPSAPAAGTPKPQPAAPTPPATKPPTQNLTGNNNLDQPRDELGRWVGMSVGQVVSVKGEGDGWKIKKLEVDDDGDHIISLVRGKEKHWELDYKNLTPSTKNPANSKKEEKSGPASKDTVNTDFDDKYSKNCREDDPLMALSGDQSPAYQKMQKEATDRQEEWINSGTKEQKLTAELGKGWTHSDDVEMGKLHDDTKYSTHIRQQSTKNDAELYRGIDFEKLDSKTVDKLSKLKPGDHLPEMKIASFTEDQGWAEMFSGEEGVVFKMSKGSGKSLGIQHVSNSICEREHLVSGQYKVKSAKNGVVEIEEVSSVTNKQFAPGKEWPIDGGLLGKGQEIPKTTKPITENSAEPDIELKQEQELIRIAKEALQRKDSPDYGQLFLKTDTQEVWYVSADGDDNMDWLQQELEEVPLVQKVTIEAEAFPKNGDGWLQLFPRVKVHNSTRSTTSNSLSGDAFGSWEEHEEFIQNWCNQYGGTTCKEGTKGYAAQKAKDAVPQAFGAKGKPAKVVKPTPGRVNDGIAKGHTVDSLHKEITDLKAKGEVKLADVHSIAAKIATLNVGDIKKLKEKLGTTASGTKNDQANSITLKALAGHQSAKEEDRQKAVKQHNATSPKEEHVQKGEDVPARPFADRLKDVQLKESGGVPYVDMLIHGLKNSGAVRGDLPPEHVFADLQRQALGHEPLNGRVSFKDMQNVTRDLAPDFGHLTPTEITDMLPHMKYTPRPADGQGKVEDTLAKRRLPHDIADKVTTNSNPEGCNQFTGPGCGIAGKDFVSDGETYYHGTDQENVGKFDPSKTGGTLSFTDNPHHASNFGEHVHKVHLDVRNPIDLRYLGAGSDEEEGRVKAKDVEDALKEHGIHINLGKGSGFTTALLNKQRKEIVRQAIDKGYDGIKVVDFKDFEADETQVFHPNQIKVL